MGEVLNASNFEREQFWMEIENKQLCMQAVLNVSSFEWKQFWKEIECKQFFIFHSYIKPVQPEKKTFLKIWRRVAFLTAKWKNDVLTRNF